MSQDIQPLIKFCERVRTAIKTNARDIRLTTNEASELATVIAQIMAGQLSPTPTKTVTNGLDGGKLK